jgi:hypothetical protein
MTDGTMADGARTRHGSCHCGAVRFAADVDLGRGTIRCNCSLCVKQRNWAAIVPASAFRLLAGDGQLGEYRCNTRTERHLFCTTCGIRPFGTGTSPRWGEYVAISVHCLDDMTDAERAGLPITYLNGRADDWDHPPVDVRNL